MHGISSKGAASKAVLLAAAVSLFLAYSCARVDRPPSGGAKWDSFLHDPQRTNDSLSALRPPLEVDWSDDVSAFAVLRGAPNEEFSSPVVSGGVLYVGASKGRFYAYDYATGSILWRSDAAGGPIEAAAVVSDGRVCFGSAGGAIKCLDARDGKDIWSHQGRAEILSSPAAADGRLFFHSSDDKLTALDAATGERLWSYSRGVFKAVKPRIQSSPAHHDGKVYQLFSDGYIVCFSADNGRELWAQKAVSSFDAPSRARRTPLIAGGAVYLIDSSNAVVSYDAATGKVKGIFSAAKASDLLVRDGVVYTAGAEEAAAVRISTGEVLWRTKLMYAPASTLFGASGAIYVLANHKYAPWGIKYLERVRAHVQAIDSSTGRIEWGANLGSMVDSNAAHGAGAVALLLNDGTVMTLAAAAK